MEEGPSTSDVSCAERERLARELESARSSYSQAAKTLHGRLGVIGKAEYQRLNRAVEEAWTKVEGARAALDRHLDEHGC